MISDSLYYRLSNDAGVIAIAGTRIYPLVIPQQVYTESTKQPCLVYTIDTEAREVLFEGSSDLVRGLVQIDCYARSYSQAQSLAAAVRDCLLDFTGTISSNTSPITSVRVKKIFLDGENNLMDEEPGLYRVMQRFIVWYHE